MEDQPVRPMPPGGAERSPLLKALSPDPRTSTPPMPLFFQGSSRSETTGQSPGSLSLPANWQNAEGVGGRGCSVCPCALLPADTSPRSHRASQAGAVSCPCCVPWRHGRCSADLTESGNAEPPEGKAGSQAHSVACLCAHHHQGTPRKGAPLPRGAGAGTHLHCI